MPRDDTPTERGVFHGVAGSRESVTSEPVADLAFGSNRAASEPGEVPPTRRGAPGVPFSPTLHGRRGLWEASARSNRRCHRSSPHPRQVDGGRGVLFQCRSPSPKTTGRSPTPSSDFLLEARGPRRGPRPARGRRPRPCPRSGTTCASSAGSVCTSPRSTAARASASRAGGRGRGARSRGRARAVRADGDRQRRARVGRGDDGSAPKLLPGLADGSHDRRGGARRSSRGPRRRRPRLGRRRARRRPRRRAARRRRATTSRSSIARAAASTVEVPAQPRPDPARRPG